MYRLYIFDLQFLITPFVSWNYYYEIYGIDKRFLSISSLIPQFDKW
jgi:hypothetical protein